MSSFTNTLLSLLALDSNHATQTSGGVVRWSVQRQSTVPHSLDRRSAPYIASTQVRGGYFAQASIGHPAQNVTLQLDTQHGDTWVLYSQGGQYSNMTRSSTFGTFNPTRSDSFTVVGQGQFAASYPGGSSASGDYFTDTFAIDGLTLDNMTMGLGVNTDLSYGIVGLGYSMNENIPSSKQYPNLPVAMVQDGATKTSAYSMWVDDLTASSGSILFGGVDTAHYEGNLALLDVVKDDNGIYSGFNVPFTYISANSSSGNETLMPQMFPMNVILDSGATLSYLPQNLSEAIWKEAGAVYSSDLAAAAIPCRYVNSTGNFTFGFGGGGANPSSVLITVDMAEFVLPIQAGTAPAFTSGPYSGQPACFFGITNATSDTYVLGDSFLRSAYVVYDLENNQVAMAQNKVNATGSSVTAFASKGAAVPGATKAAAYANVVPTGTGMATSTPSQSYGAANGFVVSGAAKFAASSVGLVALMGAGAVMLLL